MIPDLVGMKLERALEILDTLSIENVKVIVTAPPREEKIANKDMRVIRLKNRENGEFELLVCK